MSASERDLNNLQTLYNQALQLSRNGRLEEAEHCFGRLLALAPDFVEALYHRGILLMSLYRSAEALENLERAVRLRPDIAEVWIPHGNALRQLRRHAEGLESHNRALALNPDLPLALYHRGNLLLEQFKRREDALADYDRALALTPDFAEGWYARGNALSEMGRFAEAIASYDKALSLKPDMGHALKNRSRAFFQGGRIEEGIAACTESANRLNGAAPQAGTTSQLNHDREQQDYRRGLAPAPGPRPGARLDGPAVCPPDPRAALEESWRTKKPQIVVIDNFLAAEALAALRRFCLEEPVWRAAYPGGYLGAFPEQGFACPLLGQIAEELHCAFPGILGAHPLSYFWGFKYDSKHASGIAIHADSAAVNVNFWITPDDANLDPESGGLVVWDVAAPSDWDDDSFNRPDQTAAIRAFLAEKDAKPTTIPYRANRAVIFDSDLFHETDTIRFKDGYADRRVNVTMLYGWRHRAR